MGKLSREQILDTLARAEAELLRARVSCQPQLLNKPLTMLQQLDQACRDVLPERDYREKYEYQLQTFNMALQQAIQDNDVRNLKEIAELAVDITGQLYESMKADPALARVARKKKEIVFVPYKAAMWDSLESIWMAAAADTEHCHVQVVPIPYADRNPDGTAKEWHYEINLFPDYVPVVNCDEIDLEALHPDIIFFHNPYDNCNRVTSVDSRFYSDKLRRYTDKLVYVPYFVTGGKTISDHFCQVPGVFNADYVICENEVIKKIYEKNHSAIAPFSKKKFLALGSPKYDKVMTVKKEDYPLPEEWNNVISGKKVILYNTSLNTQLQNPQYIISKLQSVLAFFKERKDVAFWWRPHPLMEATLDSMIPQVAGAYRSVRDKFLTEGWGIYDDTQEMDRAILCSDAYYGDLSSMVSIYQKTGKPIMLEKLSLPIKENKKINFSFGYAWAENNQIIATNCDCTNMFLGVYAINLKTDALKFLFEIPAKYCFDYEYFVVGKIGEKIISAPGYMVEDFIEYNIKSEQIDKVNLSLNLWPNGFDGIPAFTNVIKWKDSLLFFGNTQNIIVEFDNKKSQFLVHHGWLNDVGLSQEEKSRAWFARHGAVCKGNKVYLLIVGTNAVIEYDLLTGKVVLERLLEEFRGYIISDLGDKFAVMPQDDSKILLWDYKTGRQDIYVFKSDGFKGTAFAGAVRYKNEIVCVPYEYNQFCFIDENNHSIKLSNKFGDTILSTSDERGFFGMVYHDTASNAVYLKSATINDFIEIREHGEVFIKHNVYYQELLSIIEYEAKKHNRTCLLKEQEPFGLVDLIDNITNWEALNSEETNATCADRVWSAIGGNLY